MLGFKGFFTQFFDVEFDNDPKSNEYKLLVDLLQKSEDPDFDILYKGLDLCDTTDLRDEFKNFAMPYRFDPWRQG